MKTVGIRNTVAISRFKKERFLLSMTEDAFRDEVVRPLFLRQGLKDGSDLCGPAEKGKDAVFVSVDALGIEDFYVIQTKKGGLNLSRQVNANLIEAITQLKTAFETPIYKLGKRKKYYASKAFLCCSGKVNESAKTHIAEEVKDSRLVFLDSDSLIPRIDDFMPELWLGIDADLFPYLRALKELVDTASDDHAVSDTVAQGTILDAASDNIYVDLRLGRMVMKTQRRLGEVSQVPHFEQFPATGVVSRQERLILILGEGGTGKSTALKRILYVLASRGLASDAKCKIPILVRAIDIWEKATLSLLEICVEATKSVIKSVKPSFTNDDLKSGRVVVLVDGLDELGCDKSRELAVAKLLEFHSAFGQCQIITTSREYSFVKSLEGLSKFTQFGLTQINFKQAEQILKRFESKKKLTTEKSKEILRRLQEVHGMALNPLLVTVFAATTDYSRRDIPANITELFKKFTEMMLGRWDAKKGLSQQYHAPLKDFLLKKLAFGMHQKRATSITIEEFIAFFRTELRSRGHEADVKELVEETLNRSGLFRVLGETVEFRHQLLQEFFAGRGITSKEQLESFVSDDWWRRAIVFYFGEHPGEADAFKSVIHAVSQKASAEVFDAALTMGLGLQACYLIETGEKQEIYRWVLESIADAKNEFMAVWNEKMEIPLTGFLAYYLVSRDAVACNLLCENYDSIEALVISKDLSAEQNDTRRFFLLVGLTECGFSEEAQERIKKFRPSDPRYALAIHLGCFMAQHVRVCTAEEKRIAERICDDVKWAAIKLRGQLLKECKSELLELRKGAITALPIPNRDQSKDENGDECDGGPPQNEP